MKTFFVWLPKKVSIIFGSKIFQVSLSKFGQKHFGMGHFGDVVSAIDFSAMNQLIGNFDKNIFKF